MAAAAGDRLGRYRLIAPLGRGGMGVVWRARDEELRREVAIKLLRAEPDERALQRFQLEARAVAALNHANVLVIHDVGSHEGAPYIVTELLHGQSLRERLGGSGPLGTAQVVEVALGVARGLAAAHLAGIVHRDLKPENVLCVDGGGVKLLDFGLARFRAGAPTGLETAPDAVLGTAGYMAPEQVRGQPADARADVFAFGATLYEMLAGRPAFPGDSAMERGYATITKDPEPIGRAIPPALERLVRRCLARAPDDRFASGAELLAALEAAVGATASAPTLEARRPTPASARARAPAPGHRRRRLAVGLVAAAALAAVVGVAVAVAPVARQPAPGAAAATGMRAIAVLPFRNLSGDPAQDFLAEGLTDDLITRLSGLGGIRVISRTSITGYKDTTKGLAQIGRELGVQLFIEGSVARASGHITINVRLVDAGGVTLWSGRYERDAADVLQTQGVVAAEITARVQSAVSPEERRAGRAAGARRQGLGAVRARSLARR
jgi:serine/threonine-protein kinase